MIKVCYMSGMQINEFVALVLNLFADFPRIESVSRHASSKIMESNTLVIEIFG